MKIIKILLLIILFAAFQVISLHARPAGLALSMETRVEDILEAEEEYVFYIQPEIAYAFGATGFNMGLGWSVPVAPEAETGEIEIWEEYLHTFPGIAAAFGNKNVISVEDFETEGNIYITAEHSAGMFSIENEIEIVYAPEFGVLTIPGFFHEVEFRKGSVETGVSQNILLVDEVALEETEFSVALELLIKRGFFSLEIEPVLTEERDFTLNALIKIEQFF